MTPDDVMFEVAVNIISDFDKEYEDLEKRIDNILTVLALTQPELTENSLRDYFNIGGIDLRGEETRDVASGYTSWFHIGGALRIRDLFFIGSLVNREHEMVLRYHWDDSMTEYLEKIKFKGLTTRISV